MCSRPEPPAPLGRVAVVGGTHGNEMSGVCLAQHWLRAPGSCAGPASPRCPCWPTATSTAPSPAPASRLELGPQPQGVLRADLLLRMRALVAAALDFIQLFNQGAAFPAFEMEAYRAVGGVDFPRTEAGELAGTVHPQLQDRDFEPLRPGAPIFQTFVGEDVLYEGQAALYPVFVNEAAYYEKGIAFLLTEKLTLSVPALPAPAPAP
uniref:Aminoacylase 3 n=1 Tax=Pipistrellus kuhlii TaxID=59472 RepID=A0A7J7RZY6_PIPKU|nr:aminoacylase 3 [Pipistrellus kuhlii]